MKRTTSLPVAGCALSLLLALATAGCGGSPHAAPTTTTTQPSTTTSSATTSPASSTTSTSIDVSLIPPQITVPYVNAVFASLNHLYGEVTRNDIRTESVPPQSVALLRSEFTDPLYGSELRLASDDLSIDPAAVRRPPGDRVTVVKALIRASASCVFALTATDYSDVLTRPSPAPAAEYYELVPKSRADDPSNLNPTAWMIKGSVVFPSAPYVAPPDPC